MLRPGEMISPKTTRWTRFPKTTSPKKSRAPTKNRRKTTSRKSMSRCKIWETPRFAKCPLVLSPNLGHYKAFIHNRPARPCGLIRPNPAANGRLLGAAVDSVKG